MINFTDFCADKDHYRDHLKKPFIVDDATVYCNGHVMLMTPTTEQHEQCHGKIISAMRKFIERARSGKYSLIENVVIPEKITCTSCVGTGKSSIEECEECEGGGFIEFDNNYNSYECDCKSCDGEGRITQAGGENDCTDCNGSGKAYERFAHVVISGVPINANYYDMIMSLPNTQFDAGEKDNEILYFKSDVGMGCVMGMRI